MRGAGITDCFNWIQKSNDNFPIKYSNHSVANSTIKNLILGIGNKALSDNSAGLRVVRHILRTQPTLSGLGIIESGNISYELTAVLEDVENIIVIDAAKLDRPPGTVSTFLGPEMDAILSRRQRNANETALAEIIKIAWLAKQPPAHRALITIEPKKITWGNRLSASVNKTVPQVADYALTLMSQWSGLSFDKPQPPNHQSHQTNHTKS
jgi:hydrogenase maturation protease